MPSHAPELPYWSLPAAEVMRHLGVDERGLSSAEAARRLARYGKNQLDRTGTTSRLAVLAAQFRSPLILLLVFAAATSAATGAYLDAAIVVVIVSAGAGIGYRREYVARNAVAALAARIHARVSALRDGVATAIPNTEVVPGDVLLLSAGSLIPADLRLLQATDCHVNEAVLTGESFPAEKRADPVEATAPLAARSSCAFQGSNVRSGTARGLVVATGASTHYGQLAESLTRHVPLTAFEHALRQFGALLTTAMLVVVLVVFAVNVIVGRPPVDTLLFSIALAVGLSPELLPAILAINLGRGSQNLARRGVLVRRLSAIENLGSMDILCTDKTGTLTEGVVALDGAWDARGERSPSTLAMARANAALQTGLANPLDQAILQSPRPEAGRQAEAEAEADLLAAQKLGEIPYDFIRKRLSVVLRDRSGIRLLTKGAFEGVLEACDYDQDGNQLTAQARAELRQRYTAWTAAGVRVLAVAQRRLTEDEPRDRGAERGLTFAGFLTFIDRPKADVAATIVSLAALGVTIKLITGDSELVARHVATAVGLPVRDVLTGRDLDDLHDDALRAAAETCDLFAEVDPNQKQRIITALRLRGHVVGFLGDGVNDAPAMHAADTGISVDSAVEVAKEAADFVLLEHDLDVIRGGIEEGRRTFANTMKYVLTTTSANLGNMISMAAASLVLPFLPLTAGQILLNNLLSDIPAVGIADDRVDPEAVAKPRRWDQRAVARFMLQFGLLSSVFDILTFVVLRVGFGADAALFRTGWFVESLLTELVIALVVRTRRPAYASRPGRILLISTAVLLPVSLAIPYLPGAAHLGFVAPPLSLPPVLIAITALYVLAAELLKRHSAAL
ncbi:MAG: magnesium-translocating P-type ATPase [Myxococcales bacterium]|nr:magnesium-translocating P-type ATPase [Myxococcales bacterium]